MLITKGESIDTALSTAFSAAGVVDKFYIGIEGAPPNHFFYQTDEVLAVGVGNLLELGFGQIRNNLLKFIPLNQWVLLLDSDEYLEGLLNLKQYILENPQYYAFQLMLSQWHTLEGGQTRYFNVPLFRVFKNVEGLQFSGMIHEQVADFYYQHNLPLGGVVLGGRIVHTGYDKSVEEMNKKIKRNMDLLWRSIWRFGARKGYDYYHLGIMRSWFNDYEGALEAYKKALELGIFNQEIKNEIIEKINVINGFKNKWRNNNV